MLTLVTAGLLALTQPFRARASPQQCTAGQENDFNYSEVFAPERRASHAAFRDLPGFTRSTFKANYALITPESRVWLPHEDWPGCKTSHVISRATPAHFSMFLVDMKDCQTRLESPPPSTSKGAVVQRFILVVDGSAALLPDGASESRTLATNEYFFCPDRSKDCRLAAQSAGLLVFERAVARDVAEAQAVQQGQVDASPLLDAGAEMFALRKLLPDNPTYHFNVHIMDFQPGEHLVVHEVHYNSHGLVILQGQGVYRLGEDWHSVQAGDAIWMTAYVPQWYGALGRTATRYVIYKDTQDPLIDTLAS